MANHFILIEPDNRESSQDMMLSMATSDDTDFDDLSHDFAMKDGAAVVLVRLLRKELHQTRRGGLCLRRHPLDPTQALQVSILCVALEKSLRRSEPTEKMYLNGDLISSLVCVVETFTSWEGNITIQEVALSKAAKICNYIAPYTTCYINELVTILISLLRSDQCTDARIDASCALATLAVAGANHMENHTKAKIQTVSSLLVSTLTTAASSASKSQVDDILIGLANLSCWTSSVRVKMAKGRCTIRVLTQLMQSPSTKHKHDALLISKRLLGCNASLIQLYFINAGNGRLLLQGLASAALTDSNQDTQGHAVSILIDVFVNMNSGVEQMDVVIDGLTAVAFSSAGDHVVIDAATALCKKLPALESTSNCRLQLLESVLAFVTDLSTASVQMEALTALVKVVSETIDDHILEIQPKLHDALVKTMNQIHDEQCALAVAVLRLLALDARTRFTICSNPHLVDALVSTVTKRPPTNRESYLTAVETLLLLMLESCTISCFLRLPELLPWLATFANSTTSNDKLKQDLILAIIRFSTAMLG